MDIWTQLWPNPHPEGKVHRSVVAGIRYRMSLWTRFSTIYTMVELSGIADETDKLATARALRDIRNEWRKEYNPYRWAITA